jgi:hypothetical protein
MDYPVEILPNPDYKIIDCDVSELYLLRLVYRTDDENEIVDRATGKIKSTYICSPEDHISDMSFSLLGVYNIAHIRLAFTPAGSERLMHYCAPDEFVDVPIFEEEFTNDAIRHCWCIPINKLNNVVFPYQIGNVHFNATCRVTHTPMKWNFWHFSLLWDTELGRLEDMDSKDRKKIARKLGHTTRVELTHFATLGAPEAKVLDRACYCKN